MVSAVHRASPFVASYIAIELQRGCTWLVQFIFGELFHVTPQLVLQRGCTWLVQFILCEIMLNVANLKLQRGCTWLVQFIMKDARDWGYRAPASKGLHMVSAVHPTTSSGNPVFAAASKGLHMVSAVHQGLVPRENIRSLRFKGAAHG